MHTGTHAPKNFDGFGLARNYLCTQIHAAVANCDQFFQRLVLKRCQAAASAVYALESEQDTEVALISGRLELQSTGTKRKDLSQCRSLSLGLADTHKAVFGLPLRRAGC